MKLKLPVINRATFGSGLHFNNLDRSNQTKRTLHQPLKVLAGLKPARRRKIKCKELHS